MHGVLSLRFTEVGSWWLEKFPKVILYLSLASLIFDDIRNPVLSNDLIWLVAFALAMEACPNVSTAVEIYESAGRQACSIMLQGWLLKALI